MRIRRGMVRASCDFCHRRKIKCDRLARRALGQASCAQCALRNAPCRMDDSDDLRLRRRGSGRGSGRSGEGRHPKSRASVDGDGSSTASGPPSEPPSGPPSLDDNARRPLLPLDMASLAGPRPQRAPSLAGPSAADLLPPGDLLFLDDPFQLNADSVFFLDRIFLGDGEAAPAWLDPAPVSVPADLVPAAPTPGGQRPEQPPEDPLMSPQDGRYSPPPWARCGLDEETFTGALQAYFQYTTQYLPVLLEDAFWQDYQAGRSSLSLLFAVACRGLAFTAAADKWAQQARVAEQFREAFFAAQLQANQARGRGRVRLDDLEALALMVQFKYNRRESLGGSGGIGVGAQLHAHLADLYLTHDSLVLMTMQSGINGAGEGPPAGPAPAFARLHDRRVLLFWHVYGLDAFHCLDKKTLSRLPESESDGLRAARAPGDASRPRHEEAARGGGGGYLDAVLDLSVLARRALTTLGSAAARRHGVAAADVRAVYRLLERWQRADCPPHLRKQRDRATQALQLWDTDGAHRQPQPHLPLHRAVVWVLEANCYRQVDDCVREYGVRGGGGPHAALEAEALALRVESESVRALRDAADLAQAIAEGARAGTDGGGAGTPGTPPAYSLADLGTSIVRDCCLEFGQWACGRGRAWLGRAGDAHTHASALGHVDAYVAAAAALRDAVATAVSHADTAAGVRGLDGQIAELRAARGGG